MSLRPQADPGETRPTDKNFLGFSLTTAPRGRILAVKSTGNRGHGRDLGRLRSQLTVPFPPVDHQADGSRGRGVAPSRLWRAVCWSAAALRREGRVRVRSYTYMSKGRATVQPDPPGTPTDPPGTTSSRPQQWTGPGGPLSVATKPARPPALHAQPPAAITAAGLPCPCSPPDPPATPSTRSRPPCGGARPLRGQTPSRAATAWSAHRAPAARCSP